MQARRRSAGRRRRPPGPQSPACGAAAIGPKIAHRFGRTHRARRLAAARFTFSHRKIKTLSGILSNISEKNLFNFDEALKESWYVMKRAGAQFIISYGARKSKELGISE